jgi:hypothetical protein
MVSPIDRVRGKVAEFSKKLAPCLSEAAVVAFERAHGVSLPPAYRDFLLHVGNGGAGPPHFGMVPLGELDHGFGPDEKAAWSGYPLIAEPFPFTRTWVWEEDVTSTEGTRDQVDNGSIYLGTDGCGMNWHLIVTGPDRGFVWMLTGEGITPTGPKRDFLKWYEDWLDGLDDWWTEATPEPSRLPADATDEQILGLVETWIDDLARGDYRAAHARTRHGDTYYVWSPKLIEAMINGYGLFPEDRLGKERCVVTPRAKARGRCRYRKVDRSIARDPVVAGVEYDLPLNGEWSQLTATFRVEREGTDLVLVLEEIHVF